MSGNIQVIKVAISTDGSGDFTDVTQHAFGKLLQMYLDVGDIAASFGLTITGLRTGMPVIAATGIAQADALWAPRQATHDKALAASLFAAAGEPVEDYFYLNEALTVTVASGGANKAGTLYLFVGDL